MSKPTFSSNPSHGYPNDGQAEQSLQQTIEHYPNDSIRRKGGMRLLDLG